MARLIFNGGNTVTNISINNAPSPANDPTMWVGHPITLNDPLGTNPIINATGNYLIYADMTIGNVNFVTKGQPGATFEDPDGIEILNNTNVIVVNHNPLPAIDVTAGNLTFTNNAPGLAPITNISIGATSTATITPGSNLNTLDNITMANGATFNFTINNHLIHIQSPHNGLVFSDIEKMAKIAEFIDHNFVAPANTNAAIFTPSIPLTHAADLRAYEQYANKPMLKEFIQLAFGFNDFDKVDRLIADDFLTISGVIKETDSGNFGNLPAELISLIGNYVGADINID